MSTDRQVTFSEKWNGVTYVEMTASLPDVELGWRAVDAIQHEHVNTQDAVFYRGIDAIYNQNERFSQ